MLRISLVLAAIIIAAVVILIEAPFQRASAKFCDTTTATLLSTEQISFHVYEMKVFAVGDNMNEEAPIIIRDHSKINDFAEIIRKETNRRNIEAYDLPAELGRIGFYHDVQMIGEAYFGETIIYLPSCEGFIAIDVPQEQRSRFNEILNANPETTP